MGEERAKALYGDLLLTINSKIHVRETPGRDRAVFVLNEYTINEQIRWKAVIVLG